MPMGSRSRGPSPMRPPGFLTPQASFRPEESMSPVLESIHPVLHGGRVAVITGAASGIGRAAAIELARIGMKIALADVNEASLTAVANEVEAIQREPRQAGGGVVVPADTSAVQVLAIPTDVSQLEEVVRLKEKVYEAWGEVAVLLNNAAVVHSDRKGTSWAGIDEWKKVFDVNVLGVVNVQQTFVQSMLYQENHSLIINTGSKQGITNPPGNTAYNAAKAAVKSLTEGLAHELRQQPGLNMTAHLFIPGWTHTGFGPGAAPEKPAGAWTAQETVLYMLDHVRNGDFYILCPDNDTKAPVDHLRIMWGAGDITENRPALSRWHPTYKSLFEEYMREGMAALE